MNNKMRKTIALILVSLFTLTSFVGCASVDNLLLAIEDWQTEDIVPTPPPTEDDGEKIQAGIHDAVDKENPRPDFDKEFDFVSGYVPDELPELEPEIESNVPEDTGVKTKYRMEAENAEIYITGFEGAENEWKNKFNDMNNLGFDFRLSGGLATRNANKPGARHTYKFNSDKAVGNISMNVLYGGYPNMDLAISDIVTITVNGRYINTDNMFINAEDCVTLGHNQYMLFKLVTFKINLKEGDNVIVFESLQAHGNNFDYIELETSAKITGFDNNYKNDKTSVWEVIQAPTTTEKGQLSVTYTESGVDHVQTYDLPELGENKGYNVVENADGSVVYSFKVFDNEFSFKSGALSNEKHTLTIQANGVTFKDGTKTAELREGSGMPEIVNSLDRTIKGWYNVATNKIFTTFSMPAEDIVVAPYFGASSGFQLLDPGSEQQSNGHLPQLYGDLKNTPFTAKVDIVEGGADGVAVLGKTFTYNKAISKTTSDNANAFRVLTVVDSSVAVVKLNTVHTFIYTFENKGKTDIDLTMYNVNSGINIETVDGEYNKPVVIKLKPGESMTVEMQVKYAIGGDNKNCMTYFTFNSDMEAFALGMSATIRLGS